jgi:hypothetical protein
MPLDLLLFFLLVHREVFISLDAPRLSCRLGVAHLEYLGLVVALVVPV